MWGLMCHSVLKIFILLDWIQRHLIHHMAYRYAAGLWTNSNPREKWWRGIVSITSLWATQSWLMHQHSSLPPYFSVHGNNKTLITSKVKKKTKRHTNGMLFWPFFRTAGEQSTFVNNNLETLPPLLWAPSQHSLLLLCPWGWHAQRL